MPIIQKDKDMKIIIPQQCQINQIHSQNYCLNEPRVDQRETQSNFEKQGGKMIKGIRFWGENIVQ